jgi:hypothetical protein
MAVRVIFVVRIILSKSVYTHVSNPEGATKAFRSGATGISFCAMPAQPDEETMNAPEDAAASNIVRDVQEICKAIGAAIGWGKVLYHLLDDLSNLTA